MKPRFLLVVILVSIVGYFLFIYGGPKGARVGDRASDFTLPSRNGTSSLANYRGKKVVLLNFWATWCPPCVHEMPSLEGLRRRMEGRAFELLAVSVDDAGWAAVDRFLERNPVSMRILLDARGDVSSLYGTYQLPESYLIGRDGRILKKYVGPRDWLDPAIVEDIEKYVHGS